MVEFPPVFVQKIFCFVQIPKSFAQKHEIVTGKAEGNTKENFPKHHILVERNFKRKRKDTGTIQKKETGKNTGYTLQNR